MKILYIDHDEVGPQLARAHLEPVGHEITHIASKNDVPEALENNVYDVIMIDPSPVKDPRSLVLDIRRQAAAYPYVIWLSEEPPEGALKSGVNDVLAKPLDKAALDQKLEQAAHLTKLVARIGNTEEDFPSAGGVISKSAFNQLFLSAIDRAVRYGEASFILFIDIANYQDIVHEQGNYAADYAAAKLSQALVRVRRQSDIIGQTANNEFALLLQRPIYDSEPVDAANRFAQTLGEDEGLAAVEGAKPAIHIRLVDMPAGSIVVQHEL